MRITKYSDRQYSKVGPCDAAGSLYRKEDCDLDYFRKTLTEDAVWLDDDGHIFVSRNQIVNIPLTAELDTDGTLRHGLSTMVFRKIGNDWKIAVVQAASNMMQTHLLGDKTEQ